MLLKRTSQARYKYMAIFGELVPSWLYSQLQVIDPISGVWLQPGDKEVQEQLQHQGLHRQGPQAGRVKG